ncbi:MAG: transglutaminase-like domain-containing protein [Planctomycetota bacterium]
MMKEVTLQDGFRGTAETIRRMWLLVNKATKDEHLIGIATDIALKGSRSKDYFRRAEALFNWVRKSIAYMPDPAGVEMIQDPFYTIARGAGDCDDHTVLLAALAQAVGFSVRFKTIGTRNRDEFNHVFPEIFVSGKWLSADTTESKSYLGWDSGDALISRIWDNPIFNKNLTEGGVMLGQLYTMTDGEALILKNINDLMKRIESWGMFTSADTMRKDRDELKVVSSAANTRLADPKKTYVTGILDALWNGYKTWADEGRSKVQSVYLRNLEKAANALPVPPVQVTTIIKEIIEIPATGQTLPAVSPGGVVTPPAAAAPEKIKTGTIVAIAGGVVLLGAGIWYFATRKR